LDILLDDSPALGLTELTLALDVGSAVRANLSFYPSHIDVDTEVLAALTALVKSQEDEEKYNEAVGEEARSMYSKPAITEVTQRVLLSDGKTSVLLKVEVDPDDSHLPPVVLAGIVEDMLQDIVNRLREN
jgi:Ni,Fe-hydrogenase III component G